MKTILGLVMVGLLGGCEESPERQVARKILAQMERVEVLERIEEATVEKDRLKKHMGHGDLSEKDALDMARWNEEIEDAMKAAREMGIAEDEIVGAMIRGYRRRD